MGFYHAVSRVMKSAILLTSFVRLSEFCVAIKLDERKLFYKLVDHAPCSGQIYDTNDDALCLR